MKTKNASYPIKLGSNLDIIYEDTDIIVVDKPAGLLTVGSEKNKLRTAYHILTDYVRKGSSKSRNRVFIVHRLDQWTSGLLIFAKSEEIKLKLQSEWKGVEKKYAAIVHGKFKEKEGVITSYLAENKAFVVYSTKDTVKGKLSHTQYRVVKESADLSLLEVTLLTGRKNQIRVHMADKGHPIVGDHKYSNTGPEYRRLALHARSISFKHPSTGQQMNFQSKVPSFFDLLLKGRH